MNREIKATRHLDCFTVLVDQRFVTSWGREPGAVVLEQVASQTGIGGVELARVSSQTLNLSTWKVPSIAGKYYGPCRGDSNYNFWWESRGAPGATSILGIRSDLWLEHFYKAPLHKCPLNTITMTPYSFRRSIFLSFFLFSLFLSDCHGWLYI